MINKVISDIVKIYNFLKLQGIWVLVGRVYLMVVSFLLSLYLTNYLSLEEYGNYKYVMSIFSVFAVFSLPEASQIILKYVPRLNNQLLLSSLSLRLRFSLFGSLFLLLYFFFLCFFRDKLLIEFVVLSFFFPLYFCFDLFNPFLQSKIDFKLLNKLFILRSSVQLLFVFVSVYIFESVISAVASFVISISLMNYLIFIYVKNKYEVNKKGKKNRKTRIFDRQTLILSSIGLLPIVVENFDKILIGKYFSYESLAIYTIGILIGKNINGFFKPFLTTVSAKLVHKRLESRQYLFLFIFGTILGIFLAYIIVPFLIKNFYTIEYENSIIYSRVVVYSLGIYFFQTIYYNENLYHKKSSIKNIYINNVISPTILLLFMGYVLIYIKDEELKLFMMSLLYPLRLIIIIVVIFVLKKVKQ